jgi:endonuclease I
MKVTLLYITFFLTSWFSNAQVVINEIDPDTPSTDQKEFVELKSATANFSLNGYVLVFFNGLSTGLGVASYYTIDLDGYTTDVNGNFLIGNSQVFPSPAIIFPDAKLENGPDGVALYLANESDFPLGTPATSTNLVDALINVSNDADPAPLMSALGETVSYNEAMNGTTNSPLHSIQRKLDGTYEVKPPTPKANNDGSGIPINYMTTTFDAPNYTEGQPVNITFTTSTPVTSNTNFNISLDNGGFNSSDFSGNTNITILSNTNTANTTLTLIDDVLDEGDEELIVNISGLPADVEVNNNSILRRVADTDFQVANFGTPLAPTYGQVSSTIPIGYYATLEGLSGAALKQALQDIIANPSVVHLHSYADMWDIIRVADTNPLNSGQIWDMYREEPMSKIDQQNGSSIIGKWNREHIFPQSRGGFDVAMGDFAEGINVWNNTSAAATIDGVSDAHHIRAENGQENSSRNNKNYGTVNSPTVYAGPVSGTFGSWHGDVARACFYMAVRFNGLNVLDGDPSEYLPSTTTSSGNIGDLATLLSWNVSDGRDDYEMNRNNYVQTWQNNRNPFIDYPLLADYIFGAQYGNPWFAALASESFDASEVKVFPNPAAEHIFISGLLGTSKVEIFSVSGAKVFEKTINEDQMIPIDFETGMYFVKISNNEKQIVKKIIVK